MKFAPLAPTITKKTKETPVAPTRAVVKVEKKKAPAKKKIEGIVQKNGKINIKWERFCRNFVLNREMFNNATLSFAEAYGYDLDNLSDERTVKGVTEEGTTVYGPSPRQKTEHLCAVSGARLLRKAEINTRITELLRTFVATEEVADAELARVMMQNDELTSKVQAIKQFNELRGRVIKKVDNRHTLMGFVGHFYSEVDKKEKEILKKLKNGETVV